MCRNDPPILHLVNPIAGFGDELVVRHEKERLVSFLDKALQGRPMRVSGKLVAGGSLLRVLSAQSLIKGEPHEVYYWCDICSIRRGEKMVCECCNGKMDLIEQPARK